MTPFGARMRALRAQRGLTLTDMASTLGVSPSYLSALERGRRAKPSFAFIQAAIAYFNIIWDEAEELQRLAEISAPRVTLDAADLSPRATELANRLPRALRALSEAEVEELHLFLDRAGRRDA